MKKIVMCAAFIAALAIYTTASAQEAKTKPATKTEQCSKKEGCCKSKKSDKKTEKSCDKKAGSEGCCKSKAEKK